MTASNDKGFAVRALGEIAIRCRDMDAMETFYRDIIGLPILAKRDGGITFFRIADGFAGHTSVLALFASDARGAGLPPTPDGRVESGAHASLHHLALSVPWEEQDAVMAWYTAQGIAFTVQHFDWIGWRGVFTTDPDGNTVELVAARPVEAAA